MIDANKLPKWLVITLSNGKYEQLVLRTMNPLTIQSAITQVATNNHFVVTIIQLTSAQETELLDYYSSQLEPK